MYYLDENSLLHREDGPALIYPRGTLVWYIRGKRHREDGPAVEYPNGDIEYWLNGEQYTKEEWELEWISRKLQRVKGL